VLANMSEEQLLRQGATAARVGDVESARKYFQSVIDSDAHNVAAWLGLAGVVESEEEKRRCFERILELDPDNQDAVAGMEWIAKSGPAKSVAEPHNHQPEVLHCANHPNTETLLRCNRCGKPICTKCAVHTPVGYRCKECVAGVQANYFTARGYDYPIAGVIAFLSSIVAGAFAPFLVGLIPFYGWVLMVFVAPAIAGGVAEIIRKGVGRRRGRRLWMVVCGAAIVGSLLGILLLWLVTGAFPALTFLIFIALFVSTLYARTR